MRQNRLWIVLLWLALAAETAAGNARAGDSFVVIVHADNPVESLTAREISDLFLKKVQHWPHGTRAAPVDLHERSSAREAFSQRVHRRSTIAVRSHWLKMIFSGRGTPPPEHDSVEEAVALVEAHPGAIGYVPEGTVLGSGVRRISIREIRAALP